MGKNEKNPLQWMVLYTKPRAEQKAFDALTQNGFHAYLPCMTILRQWSDRKKKVKVPIFRSYVFVYCTKRRIVEAAQDDAIVGIVRFDGNPAVVREREMEIIRQIEAGKNVVSVTNQNLKKSEKVLIHLGRLKGIEGILTEFRGDKRVAVRIEALGCNLMVEIAEKYISRQN
ncbi:MAG: UpxY family transcription antiterminator [Bacteroidales bacterium]|jgi:transcription antitermination factor NusG|nr:UpxY family transcription antiterminator [Bacteroidales bacterium]